MIIADNLVKTFTKNEKKNKKSDFNAVDGISLNVKEGEIVGILGPNGAENDASAHDVQAYESHKRYGEHPHQ